MTGYSTTQLLRDLSTADPQTFASLIETYCTQNRRLKRELAGIDIVVHGIYPNNGNPEIICSDSGLLTAVKISDAVCSLDDAK